MYGCQEDGKAILGSLQNPSCISFVDTKKPRCVNTEAVDCYATTTPTHSTIV